MADTPNNKPPAPPEAGPKPSAAQQIGNRVEPSVKSDPLASAPDPTRSVSDPAAPGGTNPGPGANEDRPAVPPMNAGAASAGSGSLVPNQPPVPAPSENVYPGIAGRPDPARTAEERQQVADSVVDSHERRYGSLNPDVEQTSDGEPDEAQVPKPIEE